jgi:hypothetical protein
MGHQSGSLSHLDPTVSARRQAEGPTFPRSWLVIERSFRISPSKRRFDALGGAGRSEACRDFGIRRELIEAAPCKPVFTQRGNHASLEGRKGPRQSDMFGIERARFVGVSLPPVREEDVLAGDRDTVRMSEWMRHMRMKANAIDERSVEAAPVLNEPAMGARCHASMVPADGVVLEDKVIIGRPAYQQGRFQVQLGSVGQDEGCGWHEFKIPASATAERRLCEADLPRSACRSAGAERQRERALH